VHRKLFALAGIAALGLAAYVGSRLHAQPQYNQVQQTNALSPAGATRTNIGVINLQAVIKNYQKWIYFENAYKNGYKHYNDQFEAIRTQALPLKQQLDKLPEGSPDRENIQEQLKRYERQIQDLSEQAKKQLGKYRDDQVVAIYREVKDAVAACAAARHIDVVLHFNEPMAPAELYHPEVIKVKMANPSCVPLYVAPEVDLTATVTEMLNRRLGGNAGSTSQR